MILHMQEKRITCMYRLSLYNSDKIHDCLAGIYVDSIKQKSRKVNLTGCERVKIQDHETLFSFLKGFFNYSFESENCQDYSSMLKSMSNARRNN